MTKSKLGKVKPIVLCVNCYHSIVEFDPKYALYECPKCKSYYIVHVYKISNRQEVNLRAD